MCDHRAGNLLRVLPEPQLREIADGLSRELFARGESVCRQGEAGSTFYIVRSGSIRVTVKGETGSEVEVAWSKSATSAS